MRLVALLSLLTLETTMTSSLSRVVFVDLVRAVSATTRGQALKTKLEKMRADAEGEVRKREASIVRARRALERSGKASDRVAYEKQIAALSDFASEREGVMDRLQEKEIEPVQLDLEKLLAPLSEKATVAVTSDHPPLVAPVECDATEWLIAQEAGRSTPTPSLERCTFTAVLSVDVMKVMASRPEKQRATAELDAFQRERQARLETEQRDLRRLTGADQEKATLELADRYQAYQRDLGEREMREAARLRAAAVAHVKARAAELGNVIVVEKIADVDPLPGTCDATFYFAENVGRKRLEGACPAMSAGAR